MPWTASDAMQGGLGAALGGPLGWGMLGVQALSGLFGGLSQAKQAREQRKQEEMNRQLQRYMYDRTATLNEGDKAREVARSLDAAPMRDRAAYMLNARMGMTPGNFQPGDMFGAPTKIPMIDQHQVAAANARYTPGAGGTSGSQNLSRDYLARLGYKYPGQGLMYG